MRKSERIRLLEMQVVRLETIVDMLQVALLGNQDDNGININSLDAGKWYNAKSNKDDNE